MCVCVFYVCFIFSWSIRYAFVFFFHLVLLVGGYLLYNIVVVFAIHWHESAMDLHVFPIPIPPPASLPQFLTVMNSAGMNIYVYVFLWMPVFSSLGYIPRSQLLIQITSCSVAKSCQTLCAPWTATCQASLSFTISQSLLKLMPIESVLVSNHLILCHPLLLPWIFPRIRVFSSESALCIRLPKYQSFSISLSSEYSGWISFRIDWFDLAVQGTLNNLLQHHN